MPLSKSIPVNENHQEEPTGCLWQPVYFICVLYSKRYGSILRQVVGDSAKGDNKEAAEMILQREVRDINSTLLQ